MHRRTITIAMVLISLICFAAATSATAPATVTYTLDASRSKFMAHASRSGLLWFKGHGHHLAASDFSGQVELTPQSITPASMRLVVKAASLHETGADFTDQQKQIINKELHDIVFHPDQYPDIVFQSTNVTAKPARSGGGYDVKLTGNLTLHGTTRQLEIPATVTLNGDELRAVGKFSIDRDDYKVKATSAFHGMVRVSNSVKFEFDIVGRRQ
ncbi:MAG TPA: YceI family protein [Pyrinomonadaceae bacterium]|nr:YceI family protein [Pyrinomonadaceae bacterium]